MSIDPDQRASAEQRPAWAWIDRAALRHNARRAIELAEGRAVIGVVKADGYGHGATDVARALLAEGVARLAVVSVAEGAALRRDGIGAPILLLGGIDDARVAERAVKWGLVPVLHDEHGLALAQSFGSAEARLAVELEVDTGMRRMGAAPIHASSLLARALDASQLAVGGVFTHLACADEPDLEKSRVQVRALTALVDEVVRAGEGRPELHVANSAGLFRREAIEGGLIESTAVRPGLMLYGVSPFEDRSAEDLDLEPAMTLAARVVATRRIGAGDSVGYGGAWTADRETTIATLPLGYADGIPRAVLARGEVHLAGAMRPIVGRVSMDSVCVDVGDEAVALGDVATVFGRTPEGERVPVEALARAAGTIGYELLVGVGARVPRLSADGPPSA
ncbi:MAG: alanine racemase [bacterium]|nr:alanine racemase [bacterium]